MMQPAIPRRRMGSASTEGKNQNTKQLGQVPIIIVSSTDLVNGRSNNTNTRHIVCHHAELRAVDNGYIYILVCRAYCMLGLRTCNILPCCGLYSTPRTSATAARTAALPFFMPASTDHIAQKRVIGVNRLTAVGPNGFRHMQQWKPAKIKRAFLPAPISYTVYNTLVMQLSRVKVRNTCQVKRIYART